MTHLLQKMCMKMTEEEVWANGVLFLFCPASTAWFADQACIV